jgi:hypothetical protein
MERGLRRNVMYHPALPRNRGGHTPTISEVNHETQPSLVEPQRAGDRSVLEAAIDVAQRSRGLVHNGPGRACGFFRHAVEHSARGSVQSVNDSAAGFIQQRHGDPSASGLDHSAETMSFPVPLPLPAPLQGPGLFQQE